jgi:1-acyl-sn-glycerol-3-phosphate acyltransferase
LAVIRGWVAIVFTSLTLVLADIVQRGVIAPWVKLRPSSRIPVLDKWIKIMAWLMTRPVAFIGGCVIPRPKPIVPGGPGVLLLMNHQSVFDIPLVIQTIEGGYPRIVTRARYSRYIPTISHMVRLYQYPVVDPSANPASMAEALDEIEEAARTSDMPLAVFPEGTRTKDGEIGRFKKGGLTRVLAARPWTVYVFVADGFWRTAKFRDFLRGLIHIEGKIEHVATLEWMDPSADPVGFLHEVRELMVARLAAMRGEVAAP